jgi:predicted DNA-binding protein YlxM (UPF0122 family)
MNRKHEINNYIALEMQKLYYAGENTMSISKKYKMPHVFVSIILRTLDTKMRETKTIIRNKAQNRLKEIEADFELYKRGEIRKNDLLQKYNASYDWYLRYSKKFNCFQPAERIRYSKDENEILVALTLLGGEIESEYFKNDQNNRNIDIIAMKLGLGNYSKRHSLQEIASKYVISRERVRQIIKAGKKIIQRELKMQKKQEESENLAQNALNKTKQDIQIDIEYLDLSVRAYNALRRSGIETIVDIFSFGLEKLINIRCVGISTHLEIIQKLKAYLPEMFDEK